MMISEIIGICAAHPVTLQRSNTPCDMCHLDSLWTPQLANTGTKLLAPLRQMLSSSPLIIHPHQTNFNMIFNKCCVIIGSFANGNVAKLQIGMSFTQ